ncbi:MAG: NEW3 domain-containing protein [Dehalococcoidales bacterium]|nr:NEW3 domain-containing protein [Dehalococcoidales bacterium]
MSRSRLVRCLIGSITLLFLIAGLFPGGVVQAQAVGTLDLTVDFPSVRGKSGDEFIFWVSVTWNGSEAKGFTVDVTAPPQWAASVTKTNQDVQIGGLRIEAFREYAEKIDVKLAPLPGISPEPGEYTATLTVASESGDISKTLDLKAIVTARYEFDISTPSGKLNVEAVAGQDNQVPIILTNTGSTPIENITFSSSKPENWSIVFSPDRVSPLEPGSPQEVMVTIKPPRNRTIAGDYGINLVVESKEFTPDSLLLRVNILTPAIWDWVGILMVVVVVAGLGSLFWQLSKR